MKTYETQEKRTALARELAREAMVLLKNESSVLPLSPGQTVAILGRTQTETVIGGGGSGASDSRNTLVIRDELAAAGLSPEETLDAWYLAMAEERKAAAGNAPEFSMEAFKGLVASGAIYELFGRYAPPEEEPLPSSALWDAAAQHTDTAICVIGRSSGGEECDRRVENDYYLTPSEQELLRQGCAAFSKLIVVFNVNGLVDMSCLDRYPQIKAAIFMGTSGEQAAGALADLITGKASPSGKLAQTAALRYEDYPTAKNISYTRDDPTLLLTYERYGLDAGANGAGQHAVSPATVYEEDVYVGYRYFDSFEKPVLFPFGYGLSYAEFAYRPGGMTVDGGKCRVAVTVENRSSRRAGKEAAQLYIHAPFGALGQPRQALKAIAKTRLLQPGEAETLTLEFRLADLASFDETASAWVLERGDHVVSVGRHSRDTLPCGVLTVPETITVLPVSADIGILPVNRDKIRLLRPERELPVPAPEGLPRISLRREDLVTARPSAPDYDFSVPAKSSTLEDVRNGRASMEEFINQMSPEELAVVCCGYGPGLPFSGLGASDAPSTIHDENGNPLAYGSHPDANPGYCNPAMDRYGIYSTWYKDGPASVGKTAWPTGMMLACTFNPQLVYEFGSACGCEAEALRVGSWLAPGLNLIRNPIEGRAFEYFSEDPFLCGLMGIAVARGAMENNALTVCPKHFAVNEQETYRRGQQKRDIDAVDTILSARAARELYLKPFEMVLTQTHPTTLMSSFNKVNGRFAAGNAVLCTEILRGEWGYDGVVVTDWGDLDFVVDGADAVAAGNDVVMPGGPPVIAQILKGLSEGRVTLEQLRRAAAHLMNYILASREYR